MSSSPLRFANNEYFLSGAWEDEVNQGNSPQIIDPNWEGTTLGKKLKQLPPLPKPEQALGFYMVTSGSTGDPKWVWKTKAQLDAEVDYWCNQTELVSHWLLGDSVQVGVPLCHLYGLLWGFLVPRRLGKTLLFQKSFVPEILSITNAIQLQWAEAESQPLPKKAIVSGMKFPVPLVRKLREKSLEIFEIYGSTETGGLGYRDGLRQNRFTLLESLEIKGNRIEPNDTKEELLVKSPFLSNYSCIAKDSGWEFRSLLEDLDYYPTGDLGNLGSFGWFLLGRKDRVVKNKGKRISLDTLESEVQSLFPEFSCLSVVVEKQGIESIALFVKDHPNLDRNKFWHNLRYELPSSLVPDLLVVEPDIPLLPNGKIDYKSIQRICQRIWDEEPTPTETSSTIGEWITQLLQLKEPLQPNQHLVYDCGMDSLRYQSLFLELERRWSAKIPEEDKRTSYFASLSGILEYEKERIFET